MVPAITITASAPSSSHRSSQIAVVILDRNPGVTLGAGVGGITSAHFAGLPTGETKQAGTTSDAGAPPTPIALLEQYATGNSLLGVNPGGLADHDDVLVTWNGSTLLSVRRTAALEPMSPSPLPV